MIRKTALLAGVAGAMLFAAPALAQDAAPPASAQTETPASITVQPGATIKGEGGVELGTLQGVRTNAAGEQELEVRGADGQLRAVPLGGLQQSGARRRRGDPAQHASGRRAGRPCDPGHAGDAQRDAGHARDPGDARCSRDARDARSGRHDARQPAGRR